MLRETIDALSANTARYRQLGVENLDRWSGRSKYTAKQSADVRVIAGDWGEVTAELTREVGQCFAVLNMANAFRPGGAYLEGTIAQEENMFRRTDCHFKIADDDLDSERRNYRPEVTRLLSAAQGRVYLDTDSPRVCIRGAEDRSRDDLGYRWLADDELFPFLELRAAAVDLRDGSSFDALEAERRIVAQFDTLQANNIKHVVLSAFGCGAFRNPAADVAAIYRDQVAARLADFRVISFAIFAPGYGPDNFAPFAETLKSLTYLSDNL